MAVKRLWYEALAEEMMMAKLKSVKRVVRPLAPDYAQLLRDIAAAIEVGFERVAAVLEERVPTEETTEQP